MLIKYLYLYLYIHIINFIKCSVISTLFIILFNKDNYFVTTCGTFEVIKLCLHLIYYDLPTINTLLHIHVVPRKITWKREVKLAVDKLWNQKLISDCSAQKSFLTFCETAILSIGNIHRIWTAVQNNIKDVRRGGIKARLLTGTYILQCNRSKFNQHEVNATCPLCQLEDEDTLHFSLNVMLSMPIARNP